MIDMKAPQKIIISHKCWEDGFEYPWYYTPLPNRKYEEYVHKATLSEWLENKMSLSNDAVAEALAEVIDKINSMK